MPNANDNPHNEPLRAHCPKCGYARIQFDKKTGQWSCNHCGFHTSAVPGMR